MYAWKISSPGEFNSIKSLVDWDEHEVCRRISFPLAIGHLVAFYNQMGKLCGFLTLGFLNDESENNLVTIGVQNTDWQSGNKLWVIDLVAPEGGCPQMLRTIMKHCDPKVSKTALYFREKYKQKRKVIL